MALNRRRSIPSPSAPRPRPVALTRPGVGEAPGSLGAGIASPQLDHLVADPYRGVPGHLDGILDALVRGAPPGVEGERALCGLARLGRDREVVAITKS
jgi:hypothetical protein